MNLNTVPGLTSSTLHYKIEGYIKNSVGNWNFVIKNCLTLYLDLHLSIYEVFLSLIIVKNEHSILVILFCQLSYLSFNVLMNNAI